MVCGGSVEAVRRGLTTIYWGLLKQPDKQKLASFCRETRKSLRDRRFRTAMRYRKQGLRLVFPQEFALLLAFSAKKPHEMRAPDEA